MTTKTNFKNFISRIQNAQDFWDLAEIEESFIETDKSFTKNVENDIQEKLDNKVFDLARSFYLTGVQIPSWIYRAYPELSKLYQN